MIARIWRGQATADNAPRYRDHATQRVFPSLASLPGHRGAYLLTRETQGEVEFLAVTLWDSIDSVKTFAGENPEIAVVEPPTSVWSWPLQKPWLAIAWGRLFAGPCRGTRRQSP